MSSIRNIHTRLANAATLPIDTPEYKNDIDISREFSNNYCCNSPEYITEIELLRSNTPSVVNKDSIGSYLYGCFQPELAIDIKCTPECITGLNNPTYSECESPVYQKIDDKLVLIGEGNSGSQALVFLEENNMFTAEDQEFLYDQGIRRVTLNYRDGNTINYLLGETVDIEDEPVEDEPVQQTYYWGWILLFLIIIICIGAFFFVGRY